MKFIDLFAGLGGFHLALKKLGHNGVFACEINEVLADLYEKNYNLRVERDIRNVNPKDIPEHDILCAGFPCQPFSKAGKQKGLKDTKNGNLFDAIISILRQHKPQYFILENVPFIRQHDNEKTWKYLEGKLHNELGYKIDSKIYSPHEFGIPQHRKRIFIVGASKGLTHFKWPGIVKTESTDIRTILEETPSVVAKVSKDRLRCLKIWQEFVDLIPLNEPMPGFPIWSNEFGATYPFEKATPYSLTAKQLAKYCGAYGKYLKGLSKAEQLKLLPSYARRKQKIFPLWKQRFIRRNREFYAKYERLFKPVAEKLRDLNTSSWQKLEWNCKEDDRTIKNYIIQFRASGVRVKKTNFAPSLVCANTQVPIIGWEGRYLTKTEGMRLQSIDGISLPDNNNVSFKALGNAVNAHIVRLIAQSLIK